MTQAVQYLFTAADAGFIAKSSLSGASLVNRAVEGETWISVDPALYDPIEQAAVLLKRGSGNPAAAGFFRYLYSRDAKKIFSSYGYEIPSAGGASADFGSATEP